MRAGARRDGAVLWILGGESAVAAAVESAASGGEWTVRRVPDAEVDAAPGDAVVDLGEPVALWGGDLVTRETDRVSALAARLAAGTSWVRMSVLGADPGARSLLQRAQFAVEEQLKSREAAVVLRVGVLLGDCGMCGVLRSAVEKWRLVPLPGIHRARFEPLALADFAAYCVQAARSAGRLDSRYDLGCGEMMTGDLFVAGLADNLGLPRSRVSLPAFTASALALLFGRAEFPAAAVRIWLECLRDGLLPRRMTPRDHFDVAITPLREAMADSVGMLLPPRRRDEGQFTNWRAPQKKGILWSRRKPPRR